MRVTPFRLVDGAVTTNAYSNTSPDWAVTAPAVGKNELELIVVEPPEPLGLVTLRTYLTNATSTTEVKV